MSSSKLSGSVVVGGECSEGAGTVLFVVPDDGGEGEESLKDARSPAGVAARSSCALRVWLIDSMIWRRGRRKRWSGRAGSVLNAGRINLAPGLVKVASSSAER